MAAIAVAAASVPRPGRTMGAAGADIANGNLTWALLAGGLLGAPLGAGWVVSAARCRAKVENLVPAGVELSVT